MSSRIWINRGEPTKCISIPTELRDWADKRKQILVVVRLKELQPADFRAIYEILTQCCDIELDQVFGSIDELERAEALRQLALEIGNRYQEPSANR